MSQPNRIRIREQIKVFRRIIFSMILLGIALGCVLVFGTMDDEVYGMGTVAGIREYDLKALVSAQTVRILRHEGEFVRRGEPLLEFDARNQHDAILRLKNEIKELELDIEVKNTALKILEQDPLPAYYRHTRNQLQEARERYMRTQKEQDVYRELYEQKAVTRREYLQVELENLANRMSVERLEEDWKKIEDGMAKQIIEGTQNEIRLLTQKRDNKIDELKMAERHLEDYIIRAPDAGILTEIPPRAGGYYSKGEVVVKFAANQNKKVIGLISEKQIFKVEPGQKVRIYANQYNYLDYGSFWGEVDVIYQLPVVQNNINYYPVKIILTDEKQPLRFGSQCEVTILTGRERIIFALLGIKSEDYLRRHGLWKEKNAKAGGK